MIERGVEVVVLAGGKGNRMGSFCYEKQKCLFPIDELPILYHIMDSLKEAFGTVSLKAVLSYKARKVKDYTERNKPKNMGVDYFYDAGEGTYGAYKELEGFIKSPFFVGIPGDVIVLPETYLLVHEASLLRKLPAVLTFSPNIDEADTHALGIVEDERVVKLAWPYENTKINEEEQSVRHMNIYGFSQDVFSLMSSFVPGNGILTQSFMNSLDANITLGGLISGNRWLHVAYKEDLDKRWLNGL